jgi:hypothetical protein
MCFIVFLTFATTAETNEEDCHQELSLTESDKTREKLKSLSLFRSIAGIVFASDKEYEKREI